MKIQGCLATLAALAMVATTAVAQPEDAAAPVATAQDAGYTIGYNMGSRMAAELGAIDTEQFIAGFRDGQGGKPARLDQDQMEAAMMAFMHQRQAEMMAVRAQQGADNAAAGAAFLKKNGKRKGVKTLKSGLQYEIIAKGAGASPQATDLVTANYRGTLIDGTEFDASQGEPVSFPLDRVIRGWQEGVALMNKGAKYRFYVPAELAYGERGAGESIGPNQTLVFEVELVDFGPAPQEVPTGE